MAWRFPKQMFHERGPKVRYTQLKTSVLKSPFGDAYLDLFDEVTRHGYGYGVRNGVPGDGDPAPNTYPYGEVYALSLMLGIEVEEANIVRWLFAMDGLAEARELAERRGGLDPFTKTGRLPEPGTLNFDYRG